MSNAIIGSLLLLLENYWKGRVFCKQFERERQILRIAFDYYHNMFCLYI